MILVGASLAPLYIIGLFGVIWKLVDSAQLMSYMIFINIDFPLNFGDFLNKLYYFNLNSLIPNPLESIFNYDFNSESKQSNIEDQVPPLKFEINKKSSSFLYNAFTIILIYIGFWLVFGLCFWVNKNYSNKLL